MKTVTILLVLIIFSSTCMSQKQTFDILTYSLQKNWKKEIKKGSVVYTISNKATKSWCQLILFSSQPGKGSIELDFENDWASLTKPLGISVAPQQTALAEADGWKIKSGTGEFTFNNAAAVTSMTTFSGYGTSVTIMANTNSQEYVPQVQQFIESISLKKPKEKKNPSAPVVSSSIQLKSRYTFSTSSFDDGWMAVEQADWIQVTKGNTKVLVHYPNPVTNEYITDRDKSVTVAWNNLVAPRYSNLKNYFVFNNAMDPESPMFISGNMTENSTGKNVYVVLFERGKSGWLEFISPDKTEFISNYGIDQSKLTFYQDPDSWNRMKKMATYNKFAIGPADINGTWTNDFTGIQQYINIYSGNSAGMSTYQSRQIFEFLPGASYKWTLSVASGMVGDIKGKTTKSGGKYTIPSNWQIRFSDISGKPATYDAYFSCIKGARVLWLSNSAYPGYDAYGRKE
jgi:hypothetical protein